MRAAGEVHKEGQRQPGLKSIRLRKAIATSATSGGRFVQKLENLPEAADIADREADGSGRIAGDQPLEQPISAP